MTSRLEPIRHRAAATILVAVKRCCLLLVATAPMALPALGAEGATGQWRRLADGFSGVYEAAAPAVVQIHSQVAPSDAVTSDGSRPGMPVINRGSGVLFSPAERSKSGRQFILTNHHVIEGAARTTVRLADGREYRANITGSDPKTDIAVVDIDDAGVSPLPMADSDDVKIGQWVLAIGNPFGLRHSLSVGIVSGTGRTNVGINSYEDYIQTDAAISPGNSGGPLINLDGEVVGITSAVFTDGDGPTGAGFAIPVNLARTVAEQLIANGKVERAYLGVFLQSLTGPLARMFGVSETRGALISEVAPASPADQAGLRVGDLIVEYQHAPVRDAGSFINDLSLTRPGTQVAMTIVRDSTPRTVTATVAARSAYERKESTDSPAPSVQMLGMTVSPLTQALAKRYGLAGADVRPGLLITAVKPGSSAARGGLEPGAVMLRLDQQPVVTLEELRQLLDARRDREELLLLVRQRGTQEFVVLER